MADIKNSKLLHIDTGILNAQDACIVLVRTEWNSAIVDELEKGCVEKLQKYNVRRIVTLTVPGAFEIPFGIKCYWEEVSKKKRPDAFIALGCVLRGETPHFEYICKAVTEGLEQLNLMLPVPSIFGVLTVDNIQQALDRIGGLQGHKGEEAAITALKMISIRKNIRKEPGNASQFRIE
jgi:6,7-dimethyl-8-ribityllumazine synthase